MHNKLKYSTGFAALTLSSFASVGGLLHQDYNKHQEQMRNPEVKRASELEQETRDLIDHQASTTSLEAYITNENGFADNYNTLREEYKKLIAKPEVKEELQKAYPTTTDVSIILAFLGIGMMAAMFSLLNLFEYGVEKLMQRRQEKTYTQPQ